MARTTYDEPVVAELIRGRFVPIWVDADRRPDINERYNLGAWPTTAFLTPNGHILGGETYVGAERMVYLLRRVADAFAARHEELEAQSVRRAPFVSASVDADPDAGVEDWLVGELLDQFDAEHGGFGTEAKHVQAEALHFAALRSRLGDSAFAPVVARTLEAIGWGGLYDAVDGGVFRYCTKRDWTKPSFEKVLDVNAAVLGLLVDGPNSGYRDRAVGLLRYVRETLIDRSDGGFFASQRADEVYYGATTKDARRALSSPPVDQSVYADGNALMATSFVRAAAAFGDSSLLEFAVTSLERVVLATYERGGGIAHQANSENSVRGLLVDQVWVSAALLDLYAATGRDAYLDMAQELMHFAVRALWHGAGGFMDRVSAPDDIGLLREPVKPFAANCAAARVLARLARLTQQAELRARAASTLASQNATVRAHGVDAAPYVLALKELTSDTTS